MVSRLSFGTVKDMVHLVRYFRRLEAKKDVHSAGNIIQTEMGLGGRRDTQRWLDLYRDIKATCMISEYCGVPGQAFQIYEQKRNVEFEAFPARLETGKYKGSFMQSRYYHVIVFSRKLISDHMPNLYEKAINEFGS